MLILSLGKWILGHWNLESQKKKKKNWEWDWQPRSQGLSSSRPLEEERHWERGWRKLSYRMTSRAFNCREKPHNELMIASGYSLSQPTRIKIL